MIESVREKSGGELAYAANWDEVWQVQFWDRLDMIGVDAYFPLSQEGEKPTAESLATAWQPNVDGLAALSGQWRLPVLVSEIGYPSQAGATAGRAEAGPSGRARESLRLQGMSQSKGLPGIVTASG